METRTKKVKRNIFTALLLQAVKMLSRIIFVRVLGASYLGINGLFNNVLSILTVADLGMYTVMMYSLYKPLAEKDEQKITAYINTFNRIYNVIAVVIAVMGVAIIPFLKYVVNLPEHMDGIYLYYVLMLTNVVVGYLFIYRTTLLQADQKSYILDRVDICVQLITFFIQIFILIITENYALYLGLNIVTTLISNLIKSNIVRKQYSYILNPAPELAQNDKKKLKENIKGVFLYRIGGVIQANTDNILTSIFAGTLTVGYYSNYTLVVLSVTTLVTMIFNTLKSSIGSFNAQSDRKAQEEMFFNFEDYNFMLIGFCSICFYAIFPDFITICFGESYLLRTTTLVFIVLNFYTSNIRQNLWVYRETTGIFSKVQYTTLVTSMFNIVLSIIGGRYYGITGIVAATVISRMLYNWWKEPTIIFRDYFNDSPRRYLLTYIVRLIYVCIMAFIVGLVSQRIRIPAGMILQGCVRAVVTVLLAGLALYIPMAKRKSMQTLKQKILGNNSRP